MTRSGRRTLWLVIAIGIVSVASIAGVLFLGAVVAQLSEANSALRTQIEDLGEEPVVGPVAGEDGKDGRPGKDGEDGKDGARGPGPTDQQVADAVAEYCAANGGCVGATGPAGPAGVQGVAGNDGKAGAPGADGATGATGPAGPAGPTCPEGYTAQTVWLSIADSQFGTFSRQQATICRPNAPNPAPTP